MNVCVIDAGNSIIKAKTASHEVAYPHALRALPESEFQSILTRAGRSGPSMASLQSRCKKQSPPKLKSSKPWRDDGLVRASYRKHPPHEILNWSAQIGVSPRQFFPKESVFYSYIVG